MILRTVVQQAYRRPHQPEGGGGGGFSFDRMPVGKCTVISVVLLVIVAIIAGLVGSSLKKLNFEDVGLQYNVHQRILGTTLYSVGLHLGPPGYKFIKFPKVYKTLSFPRITCLNKDGLEIRLSVQFQHLANLNGKDLRSLILKYENYDNYRQVVVVTAEEIIHATCSKYNVTQLQTERVGFQRDIWQKLNSVLQDELKTSVKDVQVSNIIRPSAYETVVRDKESAKQNIRVAQQERPRILTAANTKKREAETQANITLSRARTNARILITQAKANAEGILNAYKTEADTYKMIVDNQKLTIPGFLSYLTTRAIQAVKSPIYVNLDAPAKTSYP